MEAMARDDRVNALLPVEVDFQREKATGLRRSGDKLEQMLKELSEVERGLRDLTGPSRAAFVSRYMALRKEAEHQKWVLMVQREACGLRNHRDLDLVYPLPPPLKE